MANTSWSKTYTDFVTATADKVAHAKFQDVITRGSPAMNWLIDSNGVTGRPGGSRYLAGATGNEVVEPLMTELNNTVKWYAGAETVDTNDQNVGTMAHFAYKQLIASITITGAEKRQNAGKEQTINLVAARTEQAMISIKNQMAIALMDTGTNTKQIEGFPAMCPTDRGTGAAYGAITGSTTAQPWWLCQASRSYSGTYGSIGDFNTNGRDYLIRLFHDCTEGTESPDVHLVTQELQEAYVKLLQPYERVYSKAAGDLGYSHTPEFMGSPVLWDRKHPDAQATTQRWYMFNSNYLFVRYAPEANFTVLGFQRPANADFVTTPIIWHGCVTTNNRRMHGVGYGITL